VAVVVVVVKAPVAIVVAQNRQHKLSKLVQLKRVVMF
jgi:hypothetical protein